MLNALWKKQLLELAAAFTRGSRGRRSRGMLAALAALLACAFGAGGYLFYLMADQLCTPLAGQGLGWLYFALLGTMATGLGVMGSVFVAHATLYQAKDNELLLAMPIPPAQLLLVRVGCIYLLCFLFEAVALVPAAGVYLCRVRPGWAAAAFEAALLFVLPLAAAAMACMLGWLIGLAAAHMNKSAQNLAQVALTLGFAAAYYYGYTRMYGLLQRVLLDSAALGGRVRALLYPMYCLGRAAEGDAAAMALFTGMTALAFGAVYAVLARSFLRLATRRPGAARAAYREKPARRAAPQQALLRREWARLLGTPVYLMNCGLGALVLLVGTVLALAQGARLRGMLALLPEPWQAAAPLLACAAVAAAASTNVLTAPSVSLEGRCLWLLQSLPADPWLVLRAKLTLHGQATAVPAAACMLALVCVLRLDGAAAALAVACVALYAVLCGAMGLCLDLRLPSLDWTSETAAVKQSPSVLFALLGNWLPLLALGGLYLLAGRALGAVAFLALCAVLLAAAAGGCLAWLRLAPEQVTDGIRYTPMRRGG